MNNNGSAQTRMDVEPPVDCKGCGLKRDEALEQYGGYLIMPTAIPSIVTYICPRCSNMQANSNCYELTRAFILQQQDTRIIRPNEPKVVQLTPKFK